jgi:hypothetical protein
MTDSIRDIGSNATESDAGLREILRLLHRYRADVTLIGGWVPYLHQRHGDFPEWRTRIARTTELDIVVPAALAAEDRPSLSSLLTNAGFSKTEEDSGAIWVRETAGEMIEFFTPHHGTLQQVGTPRAIQGQAEIAGIQLTSLAVLIDNTMTLDLTALPDATGSLTVRVPTLGAYVLNKSLTFQDRYTTAHNGQSRAAKDIVYIRDVMAGGERVRDRVAEDFHSLKCPKSSRKRYLRTAEQTIRQFATMPTTTLDAAATQLAEREGMPEDAARADLRGYLEMLQEILVTVA